MASNDFVIECKHIANLHSVAIRAEFGKGFDLGIRKYHIWPFYEPPHEMVDGAAALGIVLSGVGFDTAAHIHDIALGRLLDLFTERLDQADRENAFVKAKQQSVLEIGTRSTTQYTIKNV